MSFCIYRSNIDFLESKCFCANKMVKINSGNIPLYVCTHCPWASRVVNESMLRPTGESVITADPNFKQPSVIEMGKEFVTSTVKHVLNGASSVSDTVYQERLAICNTCEHRENTRCKLCTCNLPRKAKRPLEECPIGKWKAVP